MNSEANLIKRLTQDKISDLPAKAIRELRDKGYNVKSEVIDGKAHYWIKEASEMTILVSPRSAKTEKIRWVEISDIHSGSLQFDKDGLDWFLKQAWAEGYRHVHISGDMVDGTHVYPGQVNWLKYVRQDDQVNNLAEVLCKYPFDYYSCDGNHDQSWMRFGAPKVGKLLAEKVPNYIHVPGQSDKIVRGDLVIAGVLKRMAHPYTSGGRATYALSYPSQTYLRRVFQAQTKFDVGGKKYDLSLLQYGHLHFDALFTVYGVIVTHPLTFQKPNDYTEGMGLGNGRTGGRLTDLLVRDGEILQHSSRVIFVPEGLK